MRRLLLSYLFLFLAGQPLSAAAPRIAALMPHLAEALYDYGLKEEVVGVPEYTSVPAGSHPKSLGPYPHIGAESVYALKPTLVLASKDGNSPSLVKALQALGVTVQIFDTRTIGTMIETLESLKDIAVTLHPESAGKNIALLAHFELEMRNLKTNGATGKKIFVQIGHDPLVTISKKTFLGEILARMGAVNVFGDSELSYPRPSLEQVLARDPETILIVNLTQTRAEADDSLKLWSRFQNLSAVRKNQLRVIPGDHLVKPGFEILAGIQELKKTLGSLK